MKLYILLWDTKTFLKRSSNAHTCVSGLRKGYSPFELVSSVCPTMKSFLLMLEYSHWPKR